jgi:lipoate-protein ligase A
MKMFRLLDTGPLCAAANMALDRIILEEVANRTVPPTLRFLQFSPPAALVGYHQDVELEIRLDYCRNHGIDVNRRHTGGGSVFFQESALGWEIFGLPGEEPFRGPYEAILNSICHAAAEGISRLGVPTRFRPRNDIEVNGRKISGTGGTTISGGFMFQATLLIKNEVELFLKALRVPVEKLKKREIESLMDRICFLSDLVRPTPPMASIKSAIASQFEAGLGINFFPAGLSATEEHRLKREIAFFQSPDWIFARTRPVNEGEPLRAITQTDAGTLRVHLWLAPGGKRVRQALIAGDFFAVPARLIHDLEASLVGQPIEKEFLKRAVQGFLESYDGQILGVPPASVADGVASAGERRDLLDWDFSRKEANDLFLLNIAPSELGKQRPRWLLLPYCSKNLDCPFREVPGCDECGACEIGDCMALARAFDLVAITVQSFEHLMDVLRSECSGTDGIYVGSCCEAFYSKHQREMEEVRARGVLVNLDCTTCYDLGKGSAAYRGRFDNKTYLNVSLIEKTIRHLHAAR